MLTKYEPAQAGADANGGLNGRGAMRSVRDGVWGSATTSNFTVSAQPKW